MNRKPFLTLIRLMVAALLLALTVSLAAAQDATPQPFLGIVPEAAENGVRVTEVVADSPAEAAGLLAGDVITALGGQAITAETVRDALAAYAVGDSVTLKVERDGKTLTLEAVLADAADFAEPTLRRVVPEIRGLQMSARPLLGVRVEDSEAGVVVREVTPDSAADKAGIAVDDIITRIGETDIERAEDVVTVLSEAAVGDTLLIEVKRGDETLSLEAVLEQTTPALPFSFEPFNFSPFSFELPFEAGPFGDKAMTGGARLGVRFETQADGARIVEVVAGSPAAAAGLQVDDVVTAVDGDKVDEERTLRDRLFAYEPGDTLTLTVRRGAETLQLEVTLDAARGILPGLRGEDREGMPEGFRFFGPDGRFKLPEGFRFFGPDGRPGMPEGFRFELPAPKTVPNI